MRISAIIKQVIDQLKNKHNVAILNIITIVTPDIGSWARMATCETWRGESVEFRLATPSLSRPKHRAGGYVKASREYSNPIRQTT